MAERSILRPNSDFTNSDLMISRLRSEVPLLDAMMVQGDRGEQYKDRCNYPAKSVPVTRSLRGKEGGAEESGGGNLRRDTDEMRGSDALGWLLPLDSG